MANPHSGNLAVHLADRSGTALVSSSQSDHNPHAQTQAQALSSLTAAAVTAFDTASRLGLGVPQRIMVEMQSTGPIILHSFLNPTTAQRAPTLYLEDHENVRGIVEQAREDLRPLSGTTDTESMRQDREMVNGVIGSGDIQDTPEIENPSQPPPPMLIASVVAPAADAAAARRAAASLEHTGRIFQREWAREQEESHVVVTDGGDG